MTPEVAALWLAQMYAGRVEDGIRVVWRYDPPLLEDLIASADVMGCHICRTPSGDEVVSK